ncbi:MAG: MAPEG family protein, partial [Sphingomicrobium sp.]
NVMLAWGYVGFRVLHSIVQATVNRVAIRFPLFALASLCLIGLTVHAAARLIHDCGWLNG